MTKKQKALETFFDNGGKVQQCPMGYAVAPVDRVGFNAMARGHIAWDGGVSEAGTGCRSTVKQSQGGER